MNTLRLSYSTTTLTVSGFWVDVVTYTLENRIVTVCDDAGDDYRFGLKVLTLESVFNGMEKDNEVKGKGNSLDFGARIYDSRLGRFLSLDPLSKKFPSESNYSFAGNSPILMIDIKGKYKYDETNKTKYREQYPMITKYLESQIKQDVLNSTIVREALKSVIPSSVPDEDKESYLNKVLSWDFGPTIVFDPAPRNLSGAHGAYDAEIDVIYLNKEYALEVENILKNSSDDVERLVAFTRFYITIIHETSHKLDYPEKIIDENGNSYTPRPKKDNFNKNIKEIGFKIENDIWGSSNFNPQERLGVEGDDCYDPGVTETIIKEAKKNDETAKTLPTVPNK